MKVHKFKVRVLKPVGRSGRLQEFIHEDMDYKSALELFRFYVDATLEFNLDVRCINILSGKRSIKLFQNH